MATYTYEISSEHNIYPNITIYDSLTDGQLDGWRMNANEGYVFYDTSANNTEFDPETMMEVPVIYYYTISYLPRTYNWANFHWVAVPRESVDENYIFGVGNNNHETI